MQNRERGPVRAAAFLNSILQLSILLATVSFSTLGCVLLPVDEDREELTPKYSSPSELYKRALAYYEARKYAKARDLFNEYVGQFPDSDLHKIALYYLGHCYQELGEYDEALVIYNRIITTYGDDDFWGEQAVKRVKQIKGDE